jgi:autotransporter-associated beta strand protein
MRMSRILVSAAVAAALASPAANANCVIVSGQGTLPNLGTNARVECSGTTTNMDIRSSVGGTTLVWLANSTTTGGIVDYTNNTSLSSLQFQSGATANGLDLQVRGTSTTVTLDSNVSLSGFSNFVVSGTTSTLNIGSGSIVNGSIQAPSFAVLGDNSTFNLGFNSVVNHDSTQDGVLGGGGRQTFNISGLILSAAGPGFSINAGGGDDVINLDTGALIDKPINGGAGSDVISLTGTGEYGFNSQLVEQLDVGVAGGANVTMTGAHEFTQVRLGGTLETSRVSGLNLNGPIAVTLQGGQLRLTNSDTQIFTGSITGTGANTGALVMAGTGTVVLSSTNTYGGNTRILSGTVVLNDGNALGASGVQNNGLLRIGGVTFANSVFGTGAIEKTANNLAVMTGNNSHSGGVFVRAGILRASQRSLGSGQLVIDSGASFELVDPGFIAAFGNVAGHAASNFTQLSGHTRYTGGTFGNLILTDGRASIIGPITVAGANGLRVQADATLEGNGTITGNVTNAGTLAPGEVAFAQNLDSLPSGAKASPLDAVMQAPGDLVGTLTINGNYAQTSTGVLEIEFDGNGGIDQLVVNGTAALDGTLRFIALNNAEGQGGTFLTASGGVSGTFANVETIGAQLPLTVLYAANSALQAPSVLTARPSTFNSQALAAADGGFAFIDVLSNRLDLGDGKRAAWGQVFGAANERSEHDASLGYQHDSVGLAGGMDWKLGRHSRIGVGIATTKGEVELDSAAGGGDVDSMLASLYLGTRAGKFDLSGGVVFVSANQDTRRVINFASIVQEVAGDTDSSLSGAFFAAGAYLGQRNGWDMRFDGRASYLVQKQDAFTEDGTSPLRLAVDEVEYEHGEAAVGFSFARPTRLKSGGELTPYARIGGRYLTALDDREIGVAFAASGASIMLLGDDRDVFQGYGSLGLLWEPKENVALQLGYSGHVSSDAKTHELRAGVSVKL